MKKRIFLIGLLVLGVTLPAFGQSPVITTPFQAQNTRSSGTIAVTNTFQSIWTADTSPKKRNGCTVQNNGTNTMWVFFGPIASATKGGSVVLAAGQWVGCATSAGAVITDQVSITGTSSDAFYAGKQ